VYNSIDAVHIAFGRESHGKVVNHFHNSFSALQNIFLTIRIAQKEKRRNQRRGEFVEVVLA
jgi:hypothetical protein